MGRHVFISYVREDLAIVQKLATELKQHGVEVWLDRERIRPGERWQSAIRKAIEDGAFFIACFSSASAERERSYANHELLIAIDQLRLRPFGQSWCIPVVLEGGVVPHRPIGGGETLADLQWADLSVDWHDGIRRLLECLACVPDSPAELSQHIASQSVGAKAVPAPQSQPSCHLSPNAPSSAGRVVLVADLVFVSPANLASQEIKAAVWRALELLDVCARTFSGGLLKTVGDLLVAVFPDAPSAVRCGVELSYLISAINPNVACRAGLEGAGLNNRANTDQQLADSVSIAARICSLANPGEILVSEQVRVLSASSEFHFCRRSVPSIKGLESSQYLYSVA